jgi:UDP:flavonoid glycosyltransferase YjiC (YdhE family)
VHETGYFFLDEEQVEPAQELTRFLQAGPPPVCVTFGSMLNTQAERVRQMILLELHERGERVIFLTGWESHQPPSEDGDVLYLESASHAWLLPQCKAVIHHGGAGTTAAGLRAGIPSLVIPHAADQPFWGGRVRALGVGPAPILVWKMNEARLTRALKEMDEPDMISAAQVIGQKIRAEKSLDVAIGLIEQEKARFP